MGSFIVQQLREDSGESLFYDQAFRVVIEDHLSYLKEHKNVTLLKLEPADAWRWRNNFYGLLKDNGIPEYLRWIVLRMNDMVSPMDFDGEQVQFLIPIEGIITRLVGVYRVRSKVS